MFDTQLRNQLTSVLFYRKQSKDVTFLSFSEFIPQNFKAGRESNFKQEILLSELLNFGDGGTCHVFCLLCIHSLDLVKSFLDYRDPTPG